MAKEIDMTEFEAPSKLLEVTREVASEASIEAPAAALEVRSKSAKELADEYQVSDRTIQTWIKIVVIAHPWLEPEALKTGKSAKTRYTPLCQELIAEYRAVATNASEEDWIASIHAANPDKLHTPQPQEAPAIRPDVLPPDDRPDSNAIAPYQRSSSLDRLLGSRPQIASTASPDQNPLVRAIHQKVASLATATVEVRQQLDQVRQMTADTHEAIQTLEDLEVVERAQAKADRHYQLEKQVYARRLKSLGVEDVLGKPQAGNAQARSA